MQHTSFFPKLISPLRKGPHTFLANNYIDQHDTGLNGVQGAEAIVSLLRARRSVHHLILGHNELGDAGCVALFDYLRSEEGKVHKLLEISLNTNNIGDAGLWAIARYLECNKTLTALFLQNNVLKGDRPIMLRFVLAVNRSNLRTLSLTCNKSLGEALSTTFIPNLSAPRLSELHLSVCSLGSSATPALLSYLTSPRSAGLHILKLNGNPLGLASVTRVVQGLERANWSLAWVEMHACSLDGVLECVNGWRKCEEQLRTNVLDRNRYLRKKAVEDALFLLPHARPALLNFGRRTKGAGARLPTELIIHILSFLAPTLSAAQHIRVCTYAASPSTLPRLELTFPPSPFSPHTLPSSWPSSGSQLSSRRIVMSNDSGTFNLRVPSPGSPYAPVPLPVKYEDRKTWLQHVGCDRFEPDMIPEVEQELELDQAGRDQLASSSEEVTTG